MSREGELLRKLEEERGLSRAEWETLIAGNTEEIRAQAARRARAAADERFGKKVYYRGIVEFTNHCRNDCYYCGIRRSNADLRRYRLTEEEILSCCREGHSLGVRTFVLQGGEDPHFTDERLLELMGAVRREFPDCAVTLSLGERSRESYQRLYDAGANRYLLRHETANEAHYGKLHPPEQSFRNRMECLRILREIGYQTGCGMMVGSPYQTVGTLAEDMLFMQEFRPEMIGMGPFLPHHATPFRDEPAGSGELTLYLLSLCRLMLPDVLLPATTALETLMPRGHEMGVLAGCNVIMPNLSPASDKKEYLLYDNKPTDSTAAQSIRALREKLAGIGYELTVGRGDYRRGAENREEN